MRRAVLLQDLALLLLVSAVVIGGIVIHNQQNHIGQLARNNGELARKTDRALKAEQAQNAERRKIRDEQAAAVHAALEKGCSDIHRLDMVFEKFISRSITAPALTLPDLTPAQKKALSKVGIVSRAAQQALLDQLEAADCKGVTRLPTATKGSP